MTVTGRTMRENLEALDIPPLDGEVLRALENPIHRTGGITILHGSLAPEGAVVKSAGFEAQVFEGNAARLRRRAGLHGRRRRRHAEEGRRLRHPLRGAQGRPGHARDAHGHRRHQGRRPRQGRPAAHRRPLLRRHDRACASATSRPRPPTAARSRWSQDGDRIRLDLDAGTLDLLVDADELERRRAGWKPLEPRYTTGVLGKYAKLVGSAAQGAITG